MTKRQAQLLAFIREFRDEHGFSPSYDDIATALGIQSKSGVSRLVEGLLERGVLMREAGPNRARSLVPAEGGAFEQGRKVGYAEGFRAALKDFAARPAGREA